MSNSTPKQLHFAPSAGFTLRAGFAGGAGCLSPAPTLCARKEYAIGSPHYVRPCLCQREKHSELQSGLFPTLTKGG